MSAQNEDFLFAQEAQDKGYVSEAQLEEAFLLQRKMAEDLKIDERIAVILVKRGWLAEEQARRVYALIEPEGHRTQIEGYRLVERIGRGAMGTVYKAVHLGLHRVVAIKVLRQELLGERIHSERLSAEAKMLASLDHPNIVRALDAGESNGFPYVVMEYVEGETLKERISRDGPLPEDEALRITRAVADALERARRMGVVHRDVKPGNILISSKGEPKLMDLGLARGPIDLELTQHGATVGTPQFMSPEQVEDAGKVDTRSDIYSLGGTLYAMLTGKPPFTASTMAEILTKVLNEQPVPVRVRNREVSPEVGYLLERMMLKDASLRYQTPAQVVEDIDNISGGQSIVPSGFTGNWEAWLLRQRIRKLTRAAVVVGLALVVLGFGFFAYDKFTAKADARAYKTTREADLAETDPAIDDTLAVAERKLAEAETIYQDISARLDDAGVDDGVPSSVTQQIHQLTSYVSHFKRFEHLRGQLNALVLERRYAAAYKLALDRAPNHAYLAVHQDWKDVSQLLVRRSDEDWHAERRRAKERAPGDLDAVASLFADYAEVLRGDYIVLGPQSPLAVERAQVYARAEEAEEIRARVEKFDRRYDEAAIRERVGRDAIAVLHREIDSGIRSLRTYVDSRWNGASWNVGLARTPLAEHVENRIRVVERRLADAVRERWAEVDRAAERAVDEGRIDEARRTVERFRDGLRTTFVPYVDQANRYVRGLDALLAERMRAEGRLERDAVRGVLAELRAGSVSGARGRVARAMSAASPQHKRRLEQLLLPIVAYERVTTRALQRLADDVATFRPATVQLLDGREIERWRPSAVNQETGEITAKAQTHRREARVYDIHQFHRDQLRTWAGDESVLDRFLMDLLDQPIGPFDRVLNLMEVPGGFRRIDNGLTNLPGVGLWDGYADEARVESEDEQLLRESWANGLVDKALINFVKGHYTLARMKYEVLRDDTKKWYYTNAAKSARADIETKYEEAKAQEAREDIERWLPGVTAEELDDGRTRIGIDFDAPESLALFEHGFGRLVDQFGVRQATPEGPIREDRFQLELLPGVTGLLRGRPLTFASPFDPGAPIVIEIDLKTRAGAFFFAIDIDGVQLGVLSADPNWYRGWRVPESLRIGDDDDLIQFYGRGRGVAFQARPSFADVSGAGWSWAPNQQGRRYADWKGKAEMEGGLFAFVPGRSYRVRLTRNRDELLLEIADLDRYEKLGDEDRERTFHKVFRHRDPSWGKRGSAGWRSEIAPNMSKGTGRIQILSWSNVIVDDLEMTGIVRRAWRARMERAEKKALEDK